jgi:predicted ABC-type ATPase
MEDSIYADLIKGVRKPTKHKVALLSCGASGAGKTTSRKRFIEDSGMTTTFVTLNLDDYWKYSINRHDVRVLYRRLVTRTIEDGYSFLFDATCRYTPDVVRLINTVKAKGYIVKLSITYAKLKTVLDRLRKREHQPTTQYFGIAAYNEIKQRIEDLMDQNVDEIYLYDNESTTRLIYHKTAKKISCFMPDADFYFDVSKYC